MKRDFYIASSRGPPLRTLQRERPRTCKIIPDFAEILIREEGSGILLFAVEGLIRLRAEIQHYGTLQLSARQKERVESLLNESDGLRLFLQATIVGTAGSNLTTSEIVQKYAGFCSQKGWNMTIRKTEEQLPDLMMELFQVGKSNDIKRGRGKKQTSLRGYRGVKFK
jgi:hypothetical protein